MNIKTENEFSYWKKKLRLFSRVALGATLLYLVSTYSFNPLMLNITPEKTSEGPATTLNEDLQLDTYLLYPESNKLDLDSIADKLLAQWGNTAEKPGCSHLAAKEANDTEQIPHVLEKKAFSSDIKFVFAVGLEGNGHHFLGPMFDSSNNTRCLPNPTRNTGFASTLAHNKMRSGLFGSKNVGEKRKQSLIDYMKVILGVAYEPSDIEHRSIIINTMCDMRVGMLSYPNGHFSNECHKTDFPDVRVLADIFEALNLDFRVMFMYRNALDILISTAVRRWFASWNKLAKMYAHINEKFIIEQQLLRLDPAFFKCFDYDSLPNLPLGFGEFFNLNNEEEFKVENYRVTVDNGEREKLRQKYAHKDKRGLYRKLQDTIDKLKGICADSGTVYV
eukprot:snap_masked-scaffold_31-processed-gene-0.19-mRNA-1 protein AED:1.00 eAED:1.00 QI:0/-1/0/0/-1/1/1/0/389